MTDAQLRAAIDELNADVGSARSGGLSAVERYDLVAELCRAIEARGHYFEHRGVLYEAERGRLMRREPTKGR